MPYVSVSFWINKPSSSPKITMQLMKNTLQFDLYLDESGEFRETSNVKEERTAQGYPSQFAGFLVPRNDIKSEAKAVFDACAKAAFGPTRAQPGNSKQFQFNRQSTDFKGRDLRGQNLLRFIRQLVREFQKRPMWEPVRLVNEEAVCYGDQVAAYTNIFAEVILRILEQKSHENPEANISVRAFCTTLMRKGFYSTKPQEYTSRVYEYLKFLAVRRGFAAESSKWELDDLILNAGRERAELRICDVLSNASHDDFKKLDFRSPRRRSDVSELLISAFGDRNWTLTVRELFERVSILIEEYSLGMALIAIAEILGSAAIFEDYDPAFIQKAQDYVSDINHKLARIGARGRDPQLATVLNWLDQIVGQQRLAALGYRLAQWLLSNVTQPLHRELKDDRQRDTIAWFEYGLHRWALTAANHEGKLFEAEAEVQEMRTLARTLARQWERAPILFDGLISQAVHLTDTFDFDRVSKDMRLIAMSLETQANLFSNYRGGEFPDPIKFDLRAKAIGTLVQNEIFKGFADAARISEARRLSDAAIEEFTDPKDQARQYQYRCHLETIVGDFPTARRYLLRSIRKSQAEENDLSHAAIGRLLMATTDEPRWLQDFTASHWLRLGMRIIIAGSPEKEKFLRAYDASNLFKSYTQSSALREFPIHNILRFLAVIEAARHRFGQSFISLRRQSDLDPIGKNQFTMAMILVACQAEVAALLWDVDCRKARQLLDHNGDELEGLKQSFNRMSEARVSQFPMMAGLINSWEVKIDKLLSEEIAPETAKQVLLELGGEVRY
jgi:hypothetical protein